MGMPGNYQPFVRHSIRWGYMTAKLSYLLAYPPPLVGACGLLALGAVIILPVYAGFSLNYIVIQNSNKLITVEEKKDERN